MAIINLVSTATAPKVGTTKAYASFSTDSVAGIATTFTSTANNNNGDAASVTGWATGDFFTLTNGGIGGATPWYQQVLGISSLRFNTNLPSSRAAVTAQPITRWERFETRFKPRRVLLTNLTTLDTYMWVKGMGTRTVIKTTAAGARSTLIGNTIWVSTNTTAIHPDILPVSNDYTVEFEY